MCEHEPREISREWLFLYMEVPENLVAAPLNNQIDGVAVYS